MMAVAFLVGAQRCGTTSLYNALAGHPAVRISTRKETKFFVDDRLYARGHERWLADSFPNSTGSEVLLDVDPEYLFFDYVAQRVHTTFPKARIVGVFRDPAQRAYSHYRFAVERGFERLPFDEALSLEESRLSTGRYENLVWNSYEARGRYATQVERYLQRFASEQCLWLRFDEMVGAPSETLGQICEHIGVSPELLPAGEDRWSRDNAAMGVRSPLLSRLIARGYSVRRRLPVFVGRSTPLAVAARTVRRWNRVAVGPERPAAAPSADAVERVREALRPEIVRFGEMTGLTVSDWLL